ncbi:unnamed protein product [Danaus chrysippus]|uniref:(African queen) hypothetical protein n=1 Tax=Danaus chrysippus TaxID=151541 RepID=A0A8J2QQA5_9NEOP|nr:unnamed protein product [Danaus chrysippus]
MENLKYCSPLLDVIDENLDRRFKQFLQLEPAANDAILASLCSLCGATLFLWGHDQEASQKEDERQYV